MKLQYFTQWQILFLGAYFFGRINSLQQLFFPINYFFRGKPLSSSHFLRIGSSLGQLLFRTATFLEEEFLGDIHLQKSYFFKAGSSAQHQLFQKSHILEKATFSEKHYSALPTFSGELPFCRGDFSKTRYLL